MKKNKLLVILSLALTLSCLLSALSMNAFADMLDGYYYVTNEEFTAVTNTYGYSSAVFTGNSYGSDDSRNNAIFVAEAQGGRLPDFYTGLDAIISEFEGIVIDSDTESDRHLRATIVAENDDILVGMTGSSVQFCENENNSSDSWGRFYSAQWGGYPQGWVNYEEFPIT